MERTCKQCGKKFIMTDSEVEFFSSKGLNIPKRCRECREANKPVQSKPVQSTQGYRKRNNYRRHNIESVLAKWLIAISLIIILISVYPTFFQSTDLEKNNNDERYEITQNSAKPDIQDVAQETLPVTAQEIAQETTQETVQEEPLEDSSATIPYKFRNDDLLQNHYNKHGIGMGFDFAKEYEQAANKVISSPDALHKNEKEDGDDVYYLESTNEFVVVSTDGFIRTYFYPDNGKSYYDKQ